MKQKELLDEKNKKELQKWLKKNSISQHKKDLLNRFNSKKKKKPMAEIIVVELFKKAFKIKDFVVMFNSIKPGFLIKNTQNINSEDTIILNGAIKLKDLENLMITCVKKYNKQKKNENNN